MIKRKERKLFKIGIVLIHVLCFYGCLLSLKAVYVVKDINRIWKGVDTFISIMRVIGR